MTASEATEYARMFAEASRALLETPMSAPGHRNAIITLRALLAAWEEEESDERLAV